MWEVIAAIVLLLLVLLAMVLMPFLPGRTLAEETEELRKAGAELRDTLIRELRLNEICQWLTDFLAGFQSAMESGVTFSDACRDLHEALKEAGVKAKKPTFNDYLRDAHGIGSKTEKKKGETT